MVTAVMGYIVLYIHTNQGLIRYSVVMKILTIGVMYRYSVEGVGSMICRMKWWESVDCEA